MRISDDANDNLSEPGVFFVGQHHAREHLTVEVVLSLAAPCSPGRRSVTIRNLVHTRQIYIVPSLNPDGAEYDIAGGSYHFWRKNRQPNPDASAPTTTATTATSGAAAAARAATGTARPTAARARSRRPRTSGWRDFIVAHPNVKTGISFHTYARPRPLPVRLHVRGRAAGHGPRRPPDVRGHGRRDAAHGRLPRREQSSDLYITDGDWNDWMYGALHRYPITIEMSGGSFYPPDEFIAGEAQAELGGRVLRREHRGLPDEDRRRGLLVARRLTVLPNRASPRFVATGEERSFASEKRGIDMIHRSIRRGVLALASRHRRAVRDSAAAGGGREFLHRHAARLGRARSGAGHRPEPRQRVGADGLLDEPVVGRGQRDEPLDALQRRRGEAGAHRDRRHRQRADRNRLQHSRVRVQRHERDAVGLGEVHLRRRGRRSARLEPGRRRRRTRSSGQWAIPGAIFKGLAIADGKLFASDFHNNEVAVFDSSWNIVDRFTDPGLPSGYAPFGIQAIGGNIFVTFAKQDADAEDEVAGQGRGFVDEFDTSGNLVAAGRPARPAERAVGARTGAVRLRTLQQRPARRQLRRRPDQRVRARRERAVHAQGRAAREQPPDHDRRPLGARVRQRRQRRADEHALLHRGAERRVARPLREDNWVRGKLRAKSGRRRPDGLVSRFSD